MTCHQLWMCIFGVVPSKNLPPLPAEAGWRDEAGLLVFSAVMKLTILLLSGLIKVQLSTVHEMPPECKKYGPILQASNCIAVLRGPGPSPQVQPGEGEHWIYPLKSQEVPQVFSPREVSLAFQGKKKLKSFSKPTALPLTFVSVKEHFTECHWPAIPIHGPIQQSTLSMLSPWSQKKLSLAKGQDHIQLMETTKVAFGAVCSTRADSDFLPPPDKLSSIHTLTQINQLTKISRVWACQQQDLLLQVHPSLLQGQQGGLSRQLQFGRHEPVPRRKAPWSSPQFLHRPSTGMWWEAKDLSGSLPLQICQEVYKNVIVSQLLVIIFPFTMAAGNMYVCIYKGEYHFCAGLASPWPFSNNNRLNIKRQKPLLGSLTSAKENE